MPTACNVVWIALLFILSCEVVASSAVSNPVFSIRQRSAPPRQRNVCKRRAAQRLPLVVDGVVAAHKHLGVRRRRRHRVRHGEKRREGLEHRVVWNVTHHVLGTFECGRVIALLNELGDLGNVPSVRASRAPAVRCQLQIEATAMSATILNAISTEDRRRHPVTAAARGSACDEESSGKERRSEVLWATCRRSTTRSRIV